MTPSIPLEPAETVLYRAHRVVTMDPDDADADAFAVRGGRLVAVGEASALAAELGPDVRSEALDGVVTPGLIDAHHHMQRAGLKALDYLAETDDVDTFIDRMRDSFDDDGPAHPPFADRLRAIVRVQPLLHALGITSVIDPAVTVDEMRAYQVARTQDLLTMRTLAMPFHELGSAATPDVDAVITHLEGIGVSTGFGDEMLRIGPIKVYVDGESLSAQAMLDEPWDAQGNRGLQRISDDDYYRLVDWCARNGWGVGAHAVGSAAISLVARAAAAAGVDVTDLRFQAIHAYIEPSEQTMRLAAEAGVIASVQPSIIWHNGAGLRRMLGSRVERTNPVRSWLDAGARVAFGSDGPFFAFDPRHLMWQTITRRVAGEERPLSADEAIDAPTALAAYTTGAAYAALAEHERGMLRPGYRADWVLWGADPTRVATDDLLGIPVLRTDVGGRTVHRRD